MSDSEDSFHSVEEGAEDVWTRDEEVDSEIEAQNEEIRNTVIPGNEPDSQEPAESLPSSSSETEFLKTDLPGLVRSEERSFSAPAGLDQGDTQHAESALTSEKLPAIQKSAPAIPVKNEKGDTDRFPNPLTLRSISETEFMEECMDNPWDEECRDLDKLIISAPDSPSVQSDKDSNSETKEWDKLSTNGTDNGSAKAAIKTAGKETVDQSLLDEWEKGWDDMELTEEDFIPVALPPTVLHPRPVLSETAKTILEERAQDVSSPLKALVSPPPAPPEASTSGGLLSKWGGWGTSLLSTATASVSTLSSQVGQGLNAVLETVEQGLGAPKPEELASMDKSSVEEKSPTEAAQSPDVDTGSSWLSGITAKVQTGGLTLVSGSLDVLEGIGRKTMDVIKERDPGLQQTKALLKGKINQPNLSEVLRDAKSTKSVAAGKSHSVSRDDQVSFVQFFDEEQGAGSWEALEILSQQCDERLQQRLQTRLDLETEKWLLEIEKLCVLLDNEDSPRDRNFVETIRKEFHSLGVGIPEPHKLIFVHSKAEEFLNEHSKAPESDVDLWCRNVHKNAVRTFAACTAKSLEQIRKITEMIYLNGSSGKQDGILLVHRVKIVRDILQSLCGEVDKLANQFAGCLALGKGAAVDSSKMQKDITARITDIFVESANSSRYLQDALVALTPIFKLSYLDSLNAPEKRTE
ncbi:protein FAM114A2-like [Paramacrobiotus metropolitanus]|uniref:protein FAM114A2-like n=1 Tax=Paramacrobiotus metropolitanus TaxID=2943436 RepID=UPI00244592C4|nr:protein FAM114A2-like [Paramacrobiotus metropolitanus]